MGLPLLWSNRVVGRLTLLPFLYSDGLKDKKLEELCLTRVKGRLMK